MTSYHRDHRKIDPSRGDRLGDGTPNDNDRVPMTFVTPEPYIGHLGLDGVGDTKGLLESQMREKHIKWMTNTRVKRVEDGHMVVEEVGEDGVAKPEKDLPFAFSMMLPAFRGIKPVAGIEGLSNPRGFTIVDKHQRNPVSYTHLTLPTKRIV